ncbi:replication protein A3, 14kDa [Guillardia theta CCMP2712]|uniref:Replication protein A3, 14kDa n=1 Tax=Guillardia theta (strain CCMP2712) TaxID=905079 RepID=L1JTN7_GUITC|nr:replication protein A3, 14kDa [Guillardia theta CCMP2712]EKX51926.1 replication protein A3, 14kDa [Guillardia theta CCMP2712]|eukprot:XP_005838906.1 replication protein A3, 14kDa [Guillardia theta CCMP2712]
MEGARVNTQILAQELMAAQGSTEWSSGEHRVGRVKGAQNGQFVHLEGPDGGDIAIDRSSSSRHYGSEFVEVYGTVNNDRSVTEIRSTDFGNNFDLKLYNEAVLLSNGEMREIFH